MIERITTIMQVEDLAAAVVRWSALLGAGPQFVDDDRWARFHVGGAYIALAGTDRVDAAGVILRVADIDAAHARQTASGLAPGPIVVGAHERRFSIAMPDGAIAIFSAPC